MVGNRVAAVVALGALALSWGCAHGDAPTDRVPGTDVIELGERTASLTGAPLPQRLGTEVVGREQVAEIMRETAAAEWPPDEARRYVEGLSAMGLWPQGEDLVGSFVTVGSDQVGGFYLPRNETIYVVADSSTSHGMFGDGDGPRDVGRDFVLAHELIHAHQHATHPELLEFFVRWHSQDDAANAASAAIEGHALRTAMEVFVASQELPTPEVVAKYFGAEPTGRLAQMPALVRLTHAFPYVRGYPLAYREGQELLDRAPASTEQVMHAEKREDDFWAMDLAGIMSALPAGCEAVYQNTLGELGISVLFDELLTDPDPEIWTGWDGDRYLAARCGDQRALLWVTSWDTREDAQLFASAYAAVAPEIARRAGFNMSPRAIERGRSVVVASSRLWNVVTDVGSGIRRTRVSTLPELRSHFENTQ